MLCKAFSIPAQPTAKQSLKGLGQQVNSLKEIDDKNR